MYLYGEIYEGAAELCLCSKNESEVLDSFEEARYVGLTYFYNTNIREERV